MACRVAPMSTPSSPNCRSAGRNSRVSMSPDLSLSKSSKALRTGGGTAPLYRKKQLRSKARAGWSSSGQATSHPNSAARRWGSRDTGAGAQAGGGPGCSASASPPVSVPRPSAAQAVRRAAAAAPGVKTTSCSVNVSGGARARTAAGGLASPPAVSTASAGWRSSLRGASTGAAFGLDATGTASPLRVVNRALIFFSPCPTQKQPSSACSLWPAVAEGSDPSKEGERDSRSRNSQKADRPSPLRLSFGVSLPVADWAKAVRAASRGTVREARSTRALTSTPKSVSIWKASSISSVGGAPVETPDPCSLA
mmetsp:Transcript_18959/g.61970  ORF Transcript_18959/g.61970 Transcript_18959/m.61970 type:complete len:309 (-) Transcript_18959:37-963(-)